MLHFIIPKLEIWFIMNLLFCLDNIDLLLDWNGSIIYRLHYLSAALPDAAR